MLTARLCKGEGARLVVREVLVAELHPFALLRLSLILSRVVCMLAYIGYFINEKREKDTRDNHVNHDTRRPVFKYHRTVYTAPRLARR